MSDDCNAGDMDELRRQAEARHDDQPSREAAMIESDSKRLLQELQIHQIELKSQNEELRRAQMELEASRLLYFELYDLAPVGYCTLNEEGLIVHANLTAATLLGLVRDELVRQPIRRFIVREERDLFHRHLHQLFAAGELDSCDLRMVKKDGTTVWVRLRSISAQDADGMPVCRTTLTDITESKRAEQALNEQKDFFHQIAENLSDFIAVVDQDGRRIYNSPSYRQFFGATSDLRNTDSFAEIHPADRERVKQVFRETVQTGRGHQIEYRFQMPDGSIRDMESRGSVLKGRDGRVEHVLVVSRDITERKRLLEQVHQMAFNDVLTGLPNRRLFTDRLRQAMAAGTRSGYFGALMFLDLDNFKPLNDAYGHDVGDLLLIEAADRLKRCVREMDTVARFGGDEFVVMLGQLDVDQAESAAEARIVAEKLRAALTEPYLLTITSAVGAETTIEHRCPASIGVALFNDHGTRPGAIIKRADSAMYQAKQAGGNQVRFCDAPVTGGGGTVDRGGA